MNKWRIYVAGITLEVEGGNDFEALRKTGLFQTIKQADYFQTFDRDNMWIYRVEINGKTETAVIKRTENESSTHSPIVE